MPAAPSPLLGGSGGTGFSYQATQWMRQQPWYQALMQQWGNPSPSNFTDAQKAAVADGISKDPTMQKFVITQGDDWQVDDQGNISPKNHIVRDALIAGGLFAGGIGAASLLAGAAPAAAGTTAAAAPTAAATTAATVPTAATVGTVASAATPSVWRTFATAAIPAVAGLGAAAIQSSATTDAAKIQAQSAANALALQKQIYEQNRSDLSPYRATGLGALSNLDKLAGVTPQYVSDLPDPSAPSGTTPPTGTSTTTPPTSTTPNPNTPQSLNTLAAQPTPTGAPPTAPPIQSTALVTLRAPDGTVQQVPQTQSGYYISKGAVAV